MKRLVGDEFLMQWLDGFIVCDARVKYFENVVLGI